MHSFDLIDERGSLACRRILEFVGMGPTMPSGFEPWVLSALDMRIGGDEVWCHVPDGWIWPCAVVVGSSFGREDEWHVFPSFKEAASAASMALVPYIGGYGDVRVVDATLAPKNAERHQTATDWLP